MRLRLQRWRLVWLLFFCLPLAAQDTVRFAVIGDSGTGDRHQHEVARQMADWHERLPFGLVLMLGDNIYGRLWRGGHRQSFEKKFDQPYAELLTRGVVFRAALGNHDLYTRDGRDLIEDRARFHIDGPEGYYSFTAGRLADGSPLLEFFVLNSVRLEKNKQDPAQLAWLEQALAASRARWRVAYFHHPIYSTGARHGSDRELRAKLEPLFRGDAARPCVQLVLSGHDHIYQRFHPQQGILYFIVGASGKLRRGNARPDPRVAAANDQARSFLLIEATPDRLLFWAIDQAGRAFDCATLGADGAVAARPCP